MDLHRQSLAGGTAKPDRALLAVGMMTLVVIVTVIAAVGAAIYWLATSDVIADPSFSSGFVLLVGFALLTIALRHGGRRY